MTLPPDIASLSEDEAFQELERLDAKQASQGLSSAEERRLRNVELRLEQFTPEAELKRAADLQKRAAQGEKFEETITHTGPVQTVQAFRVAEKRPLGMFFLGAGFLLWAGYARMKRKR
jgi:hypothetical protein